MLQHPMSDQGPRAFRGNTANPRSRSLATVATPAKDVTAVANVAAMENLGVPDWLMKDDRAGPSVSKVGRITQGHARGCN